MGLQIPYHLVANIGNVLRKSRIRIHHYNFFTIKTSVRTLTTSFSKNHKSTSQNFFSCGKKNNSYFSFFKLDKISEELSYIPYTKEVFNNRLYPEIRAENDPILESIVNASTVEEIFDLIKDHPHNEVYGSQAIVTLALLSKAYSSLRSEMTLLNSVEEKHFIQVVKSHPQFWSTVDCVEKSSSLLSDHVLTTILLCLNKFEIPPWDPCLTSIWLDSLTRIGSFSLEALRNWCLATILPNHSGRLALPAALPAFHRHMNQFQSMADFGMLVTCFAAIAPIVHKTGPTARIFIDHVNRLLDTNFLNEDTPLSILVGLLHALYLVAKTNASSSSANLKILYLLLNSPQMSDPASVGYFDVIRKTWETVSEPIGLVRRMEELSCNLLEKLDIQIEHISLLSHVSHSYETSSDRKNQLELHLLRIMENEPLSKIEPHLKQIFRIIRASKISDTKLVDLYWNLVLKNLNRHFSHQDEFMSFFLDTAQWYMFFNNNLGGTYRSKLFENHILLAIDTIIEGDWRQPVANVRFFCRMAAFVLAYGGHPTRNDLLAKLNEIEEQLTIQDIYYLSRGIQLGRHWLNRSQMHYSQRNMGDLLSLLNRRSVELFSSTTSSTLSLSTTLLHAAHYRNTEIYGSLNLYEIGLQKCETQLSEITARVTRDLVFFLDRFHYVHFKIIDTIVDYVLKRHEHLGPSTIINAYVLCFSSGYSSNALDRLAPVTLKLLELKEHGLFGLSVLEAGLALLYSNRMSIKLVNQIFAIDFLEKLDSEVANCYSKTSYPLRVRRTLMELNRCVCIDMPEAGVPWFHEKYCQEQVQTRAPVSSNFHEDVYDCLVHILGSEKFIKRWALSPYYHVIDFELTLNENGKPIIPSSDKLKEPNNHEEKVAIMALVPMYFTINHGHMRGLKLLRHRQLEILGYRVVGIPYYHWNSLALSTPEAKTNYLKQKLFKQRHVCTKRSFDKAVAYTLHCIRRLAEEPDWKFTSRIQKGIPISLTVWSIFPCCLGRFAFQLFNPNGEKRGNVEWLRSIQIRFDCTDFAQSIVGKDGPTLISTFTKFSTQFTGFCWRIPCSTKYCNR